MKFLRWITAVLLITASFGQLNRLFIGDSNDLVLYVNDLLIGVIAVWYLVAAIIARKQWRIPPVMLAILAWMAIGFLGLLFAMADLSRLEWLVSLSYLLRYAAYVLIFFFIAYDSVVFVRDYSQRQYWLRWWLTVLLFSGLLMAIGGFVQLYFLPDLSILAKYGWDPHLNRLVTAMLDPNYAGCYFSIVIAVAVSLFLYIDKHYLARAALLVYIAVLLLALLLTFSRSGYIMLVIVLGCIAVIKSRWLLLVGIAVGVIIFLSVPRVQTRILGAFQVDASAQPRILSWQNSWSIAQKNPILGVGFNSYRYAQDRYGIVSLDKSGNAGAGADSSWLFILATTGWLGLLWFVINYLGLLYISVTFYLRSQVASHRAMALALGSILVGLAVASQFNNALFYTWIIEPLWLLCGLVLGLTVPLTKAEHDQT